tara:strand:+ start:1487 stop:2443 length:957 start_codon:yes stop_codon:yes gene_type:complete
MGFFKNLKNKVRSMENQLMQDSMSPQVAPTLGSFLGEKRDRPSINFNRPTSISPLRMPSRNLAPRFSGGGLRSIFSRLIRNNPKFRGIQRMPMPVPMQSITLPGGQTAQIPKINEQQINRINANLQSAGYPQIPMPPAIPNNMMTAPSLPMQENMPVERFPMERPGFAGGEGVDINRIIAEQGARESISPPEMKAQSIKEFLGETGRTISNRDAELYGMGLLSFEELMQRVQDSNMREVLGESGRTLSNMDRNLLQQEQMFFPKEEKSFRDFQRAFKGTRLGDFLSFIPDQMQVADYMNYKREQGSLDDLIDDLEKKN